ncbi:MAG: lactate racemase domain-containing protein [Kiritimatiellae bacterium]|nr:lactate racemase domain-containing protein [Kiritimatiellia bacterium]
MSWFKEESKCLSKECVLELVRQFAEESRKRIRKNPRRVLLLPPDITRAHSGAGWITEELYRIFSMFADVHLIPTLGQHVPHTSEQNRWMFGNIPEERIHAHDWREGSKVIGEVPAAFVREVSGGKADWPIPVALNRFLLEGNWDLILHIGHVVPHEVLGFASHNKNYFIGLGGKPTICASHMMAACCGIENNLGRLVTPLRTCYDKAEAEYLTRLPDAYLLLTMAYDSTGHLAHTGVYAGNDTETYLEAAKASQRQNITIVPPLKKVVAVMQGNEFHSTWVANKAIYRTRMAMADGGELLIIAPGLERFGEQPDVDAVIRKYGYAGTERIMDLWRTCPANGDLRDLTHATAHLIHGSAEGRFTITYAPGHLTKDEINGVGFQHMDLDSALRRYNPERMHNGFNVMPDGEEIYFIATPSAGLWSTRKRMGDSRDVKKD